MEELASHPEWKSVRSPDGHFIYVRWSQLVGGKPFDVCAYLNTENGRKLCQDHVLTLNAKCVIPENLTWHPRIKELQEMALLDREVRCSTSGCPVFGPVDKMIYIENRGWFCATCYQNRSRKKDELQPAHNPACVTIYALLCAEHVRLIEEQEIIEKRLEEVQNLKRIFNPDAADEAVRKFLQSRE